MTTNQAKRSASPLAAALLLLVVAVAFAGVWNAGFVDYDDSDYVLTNAHVASGLSLANVEWAFTHTHASNWHPLTWIAHMVNVELFGLAPRGHHVVNVAVHALNAWLVFALLVRFGAARTSAWLGAALFALHPLRVESVAWVAELKDVLGACFALLALHAWTSWVERRGAVRYLLAALLFACGLCAKPTVVTLPFALLLFDAWPFVRFESTHRARCVALLVAEKLPFFALAAAASLATVYAQGEGQALGVADDYPLGGRIANALHAYRTYLTQTVWPVDLVPFYPYEARSFADASVIKGVLALGLFTFLAWRARALAPWALVAWFWFLGTLVPMIGLVQVGGQSHADRYTYLPHVGLALLVAFALERVSHERKTLPRSLAVAVLLACGVGTVLQTRVWRSSETLFRHALAHTEQSYVMQNALANVLIDDGRSDEALGLLDETVRDFPRFRKARYNRMRALLELGRFDDARAERDAWLALEPGDVAFSLELARLGLANGELARFEAEAEALLVRNPAAVELRRELALERLVAGRAEDGYQSLQFASTLRPADAKLANEASGARELARTPDALGPDGLALERALAERLVRRADRLEARGESAAADACRARAAEFARAPH
ncbi:MAG: tetratricopeptide repeat protein [Planctomycetes bacterium]|nr:tetratricopeptide repeat protein [Planctomycetota bacterium]